VARLNYFKRPLKDNRFGMSDSSLFWVVSQPLSQDKLVQNKPQNIALITSICKCQKPLAAETQLEICLNFVKQKAYRFRKRNTILIHFKKGIALEFS
jgi:hypothetical protein